MKILFVALPVTPAAAQAAPVRSGASADQAARVRPLETYDDSRLGSDHGNDTIWPVTYRAEP